MHIGKATANSNSFGLPSSLLLSASFSLATQEKRSQKKKLSNITSNVELHRTNRNGWKKMLFFLISLIEWKPFDVSKNKWKKIPKTSHISEYICVSTVKSVCAVGYMVLLLAACRHFSSFFGPIDFSFLFLLSFSLSLFIRLSLSRSLSLAFHHLSSRLKNVLSVGKIYVVLCL